MTLPSMLAIGRAELFPALLWGSIAFALILPHLGFTPVWDGWQFFQQCHLGVGRIDMLRCHGHSSAFYNVLFAAVQAVRPGDLVLPALVVFSMGIGAVLAIRVMLREFFGEQLSPFTAWTLAFLFLLNPVFLAHIVQPVLDSVLAALFAFFLLALIKGRPVIAALVALAMCFTKEPGALYYAAGTASMALLAARSGATAAERLRGALLWLRRNAVLVLPGVIFMWYMLSFPPHHDGGRSWGELASRMVGEDSVEYLWRQGASLFVLNFAWLLAALALAGFVVRRFARADAPASGWLRPDVRHVLLLCLLAVFLIHTRVPFVNNPRYVLPLYTLLLLLAVDGLLAVTARALRVRPFIAVTLAGLSVISANVVIDPASKLAFGTAPFGERRLLGMQTLRPAGGFDLDPLVYNFEYMHLARLAERAVQQFGLHATYYVDPQLTWFAFADLRTWSKDEPHRRRTYGAGTLRIDMRRAPRRWADSSGYFMAFPNSDVGRHLWTLLRDHDVVVRHTLRDGPYTLDVYAFGAASIGRESTARMP